MAHRSAPWPRRPRSVPAARIDPVRTPGGKVRWITSLSPEASDAYAAAVSSVVPAVERSLGSEVVADHASPGHDGDPEFQLVPWELARRRWRAQTRRGLAGDVRAVVVADVRECFASITPASVARALRSAGATEAAIEVVVSCLRAFEDEGVAGLPVGPPPSAVLANATLTRLDDALRREHRPHLRWVDDIVVFAPSVPAARRSLEQLRRAGASVGLELHSSKTRILEHRLDAIAVLRLATSPGAGGSVA
ncbi:MAG: RNA-directed DNA polymerase [Actinomycetota bacterium]